MKPMNSLKTVYFNQEAIVPSKIVCIGKNYVEHIEELNDEQAEKPVIFIKPNSAISDTIYFHATDRVDYEAEIAFLIRNGQLTAVAIGLDLTKRLLQRELKNAGLPWERSKAFDHSAIFSQFVPCPDDTSSLRLELWINNELRQVANEALMLTKPVDILSEIASFMTLIDNDIVMTGTPKGVGPIQKDDKIIGKLYQDDTVIVEQEWHVA
jgi:2-keto-4-pentenoate hydratase/2-oxohepta-3-ene-1,7-dioic acid hydratase in catechol pathway